MPPLRDTLSRRSKTSCNRSYSPLLCRSRKSVSLSWRDGPLSANSIFTPTPPMQKQYGFLTVCKNREMRSFRESALSKVIPLTSGRDSAATAPMSTLLICSSSCVVNFTVNLLRRLIAVSYTHLAHIANFSEYRCDQVISLCKEFLNAQRKVEQNGSKQHRVDR